MLGLDSTELEVSGNEIALASPAVLLWKLIITGMYPRSTAVVERGRRGAGEDILASLVMRRWERAEHWPLGGGDVRGSAAYSSTTNSFEGVSIFTYSI